MHSLKEDVRAMLLEQGFDLVGFTTAEKNPSLEEFYRDWVSKGYVGSLDYITRGIEKRGNPELIMEGAKSVIMLAMNYYTKDAPLPEQGKPYGRIAHYARGQDYHKVHEAKAKKAMEYFTERFPEEQFRFYVDYGPLAERYYAQKAGLGFVGKNCMLITPEFGSWVFLSGFITTMEFPPDAPMKNQCGECTKCIPACPGKAFESPFILNAPKCVSYQNTIAYKRHVPEEQKKAMRPWIFGCDVCQNVCPFNKHPKETLHPEFRPVPELDTHFDLEEPLRHTKETFWEKYKTTLIRNWW